MKYVKMLGLAAVAAMALTAFLGASSASATVLCTTTSTPCGGTAWEVNELTLSAITSTSLHSTGGSLEATCTGSSTTVTEKTKGSSTTTPVGKVETSELTWSGCSQTTDTLAGGELEVHSISSTDNGTVTAKGFEVTVVIAGVSCIFGAQGGTHLGVLTGGTPAIVHIDAVVNKVGGSFLCPSDSKWEGTYQVTNHHELYVEPS